MVRFLIKQWTEPNNMTEKQSTTMFIYRTGFRLNNMLFNKWNHTKQNNLCPETSYLSFFQSVEKTFNILVINLLWILKLMRAKPNVKNITVVKHYCMITSCFRLKRETLINTKIIILSDYLEETWNCLWIKVKLIRVVFRRLPLSK